MLSVVLPLRTLDTNSNRSIATIFAGLSPHIRLYVGIQDIQASDQALLGQLDDCSNVTLVDSTKCDRLSSNLNNILRQVSTKYAVRMDGDDFMHPARLRHLSLYLNRESPAIVGQSYVPLMDKLKAPRVVPQSDSLLNKSALLLGVPFAHPSITLNLELLSSCPYNESHIYAQDYHLYVDHIFSGSFDGIPSCAVYYNTPSYANVANIPKRLSQLKSHESAMFKLWRMLDGLPFEVTPELIHAVRCHLVTSEASSIPITSETRAHCVDCVNQARQSLAKLFRAV